MVRTGSSPYTPLQTIGFYLLVALLPLLTLAALGELTARLLSGAFTLPAPPAPQRVDPYRSNPFMARFRPFLHTHIPGSVYTQARADYAVRYTITAAGFRGPDSGGAGGREGRRRLVVIGDSIVEGQGIEFNGTFTRLIGEPLSRVGWEVVNAGVQGASPIYYAANVERYAALKPDAVLVVLYENDLHEDRQQECDYFDLPFIENAGAWFGSAPENKLLSRSRLCAVLCRLWRQFHETPLQRIIHNNRERQCCPKEPPALFLTPPDKLPADFIAGQWALSRHYLDYTLDAFRRENVDVGLAFLSFHALNESSPYYHRIRQLDGLIFDWAEERHVDYCSLLSPLANTFGRSKPAEYLIEDDDHPTRQAQLKLAEMLTPFVLRVFGG